MDRIDFDKDPFDGVIAAIDAMESEPDRHLSIQMDQAVKEAVRAAKNSGKKAEVTVKVTVSSEPDRRVVFQGSVSAKLPKPPASAVTLYADSDGCIHRTDPGQLEFDHRKLRAPKQEA